MATARALPLPASTPVEFDVVRLNEPLATEHGVLPSGAEGTVVVLWGEGGYGVEFDQPLQGVFTVRSDQLTILPRH